MKVEKVSATIRYSQDTGKGAWKVVELGAEGSVDAREQWQQAQAFLYAELGKQMKTLWSNGSTNGVSVLPGKDNGPDGAESHGAGPAEPKPTPPDATRALVRGASSGLHPEERQGW